MLVQDTVFDKMAERMAKAYSTIKIGDPLDPNTLCGPLHSQTQIETFRYGVEEA